MKKMITIYLIIYLQLCFVLAQDTLSNGKALNIPAKKYGISIGNSYEFNGIRINFKDKNVKRINGLNFTFWLPKFPMEYEVVNGLNLGILNFAKTVQPLSIGVLSTGTYKMNGLAIGGLYSIVGSLNGFAFGGLFIACGNSNGLAISGLGIFDEDGTATYSGITLAGAGIYAGKAINGLAIGGLAVVTPGTINGIVIAAYSKSNQMRGLSCAIVNKSNELHGIQLGLLNYAGNNPKGLRMLPFINFHVGKN